MIPVIVPTKDGSPTLYVKELDEHYHSTNGAVGESMHVYIEAGYDFCGDNPVTVFEVGFGTGLNALLTAVRSAEQKRVTHYVAIENNPLPKELTDSLNYHDLLGKDSRSLFNKIHEADWNRRVEVSEYFSLYKIEGSFLSYHPEIEAGVAYFDAFAPSRQPELWTNQILEKVHAILKSGGIFVTYSARGELKRTLRSIGFKVELLPGASGKREMVRAVKI